MILVKTKNLLKIIKPRKNIIFFNHLENYIEFKSYYILLNSVLIILLFNYIIN